MRYHDNKIYPEERTNKQTNEWMDSRKKTPLPKLSGGKGNTHDTVVRSFVYRKHNITTLQNIMTSHNSTTSQRHLQMPATYQ